MLSLQNVTKAFRTEEIETTALNEININISKGEFVSIMGPSGCSTISMAANTTFSKRKFRNTRSASSLAYANTTSVSSSRVST